MVKPGFVLTSLVKRVDTAVYQIASDVAMHQFRSGLHVFGLATDGVAYALDDANRHLLSPDAIKAAEDARQGILSGAIKVTDAMSQ
jgi:basic membrane protein A